MPSYGFNEGGPTIPPRYQFPGFGQVPTYQNPGAIGVQFPNYHPPKTPTGPPRYGVSLPGMGAPSYGSYTGNSSFNDPTLAAGASYSGGGGGEAIPQGAIPVPPFGGGNTNLMYGKGFRKKFVNGSWFWIPPTTGQQLLDNPPRYNYQPTM